MIALFLTPVYILINLYVLRWMFHWMGSCHYLFQTLAFRIIYAGVYAVLASALLTGFLTKRLPFSPSYSEGNQQLLFGYF